jgi:hypothetical protein
MGLGPYRGSSMADRRFRKQPSLEVVPLLTNLYQTATPGLHARVTNKIASRVVSGSKSGCW